MKTLRIGTAILLVTALAGCGGGDAPSDMSAGHEEVATPTNRIDIPSAVRRNLGITFVTVERRRVAETLRVPGAFELIPDARREYRTMLPGRVELAVSQFDTVEAGDLLYRIDSPAWREMQQRIADASSSIMRLQTKYDTFDALEAAHEIHEESLIESVTLWSERVDQLESLRDSGGGRGAELAAARAELATARAALAEVHETDAELEAARAETTADLTAARSREAFLLDAVSSLLMMERSKLAEDSSGAPAWSTIRLIDVRATEAGVVESVGLTNGGWADEKTTVLTVVQPDRLRFHAKGLQSDMGVLRDGLAARIVPPTPTMAGRAVPLVDAMAGALSVGLEAHASDRTVDLYVTPAELASWARAGVSAHLEIVIGETTNEEIAIPLAAVQRDGIRPVIFRRAPDDPNQAIRIEADLGRDDGRWVAVLSGLADGDEVVLDGGFQLMLATSGSMPKGGHFHADGTFHAEDH